MWHSDRTLPRIPEEGDMHSILVSLGSILVLVVGNDWGWSPGFMAPWLCGFVGGQLTLTSVTCENHEEQSLRPLHRHLWNVLVREPSLP